MLTLSVTPACRAWEDPVVPVPAFNAGHRSKKPHSLPLKRGMLHYAYSRKLPVQIIISAGKEAVLDEKECRVGFGCTIVTSYSEVIQAQQYPDFEAYFNKIQTVWHAEWQQVFTADPAGESMHLKLHDIQRYMHSQVKG